MKFKSRDVFRALSGLAKPQRGQTFGMFQRRVSFRRWMEKHTSNVPRLNFHFSRALTKKTSRSQSDFIHLARVVLMGWQNFPEIADASEELLSETVRDANIRTLATRVMNKICFKKEDEALTVGME